MELNELKNKRILILGFGKEGKDSFLALRKMFPEKVLGIADQVSGFRFQVSGLIKNDKKLKLHFGKNYLKAIKNYDLIIKTPGIPSRVIKPFLKRGTKVTSQTEIFFENCPGIIIGVTGTKGKGTTSSLIYQILRKGGLKVKLVGNIGKPVLQTLLKATKDDIFVYELSSHQLENLKKSPQIAVFLNLYPAHLDYYGSFKNYKKVKENITLHQTKNDFFIYNSEQKELKELTKKTKAKKIPITARKYKFITNIRKNLLGRFNIFNIASAVAVAELFDVPKNKIIKAIKEFKPLLHRLEFVGKYKGIAFYNDSLATVPQSAEGALDALGDKVKTLILGGSKVKGFDFSQLAKKILKSKVRTLIFLSPGTAQEVLQEILFLKKKKLPQAFFVSSMPEAVKIAYQQTNKREICLLSPGAPSFNLFRNYKERGNLFKKYVKKYGH
ncbi:MAG: UDP-N-acetylmuramoyl-L-alanine--D-glutamate ligase [Patescibacteria group bacterium]|nr:UDP-N-acetylmuramoyl-L-alanine--D-glutamate ligase [Patescibacteria group bacterium]